MIRSSSIFPSILVCFGLLTACGETDPIVTNNQQQNNTQTNNLAMMNNRQDMGTFNNTKMDMNTQNMQDMKMVNANNFAGLIPIVYAHSSDTLFSLNPKTKAVTEIGLFDGCSGVIDMAVDKDQRIYATTFDGLYGIDSKTAKCFKIAEGSFPNSLSFVPEGTLFDNQEALVGYLGETYIQISLVDGKITEIGELSDGFISSGDIVSVKGGGTYLTVYGPGCMDSDCLLEVDPKTGDLVKNWGSVDHEDVFGLAFWSGTVYGFSDTGEFFSLDFSGQDLMISPLSFPSAPNDLKFWGAGSTTIAPIFE